MKYEINLSENKTYVRIQVLGTITGDSQDEFIRHAIAIAKENKMSRYLVDVRQARNVSKPYRQYKSAYYDMSQQMLEKYSRIAVLINAEDDSHNFIETVYRNAGYDCRLFEDEETATKWLHEKESI